MKPYFISLFNYDQFVNAVFVKLITKAGEPEKAVKLVAHLLAVQQQWYNRLAGGSENGVALWPDWDVKTIETTIAANHKAWLEYLNGLPDDEFEKNLGYSNSKGEHFENRISDILAHIINHSTHHRAQAGQLLKAAGIDPLPNTDYINYVRYVQPR